MGLPLAPGTVGVWSVDLTRPPPATLFGRLSATEQARAQCYVHQRRRDCFVAARGVLRTLVARERNEPASAVHLVATSTGKPFVADDPGLFVSVSHTDVVALVALTRVAPVGVDVEAVRTAVSDELVSSCCSAAESDALAAVPVADRGARFFSVWTRKEAVAKADGRGLGLPLAAAVVSVGPAGPVEVLSVPADAGTHWTLFDLSGALRPLRPDHVAAVAVAARDVSVRWCGPWNGPAGEPGRRDR